MKLKFLFAPADSITEPSGKGTLSVDDISDALNEPEPDNEDVLDIEPKKEKKVSEEKPEGEDKEDEGEEEKTDEELELEELEDELADKDDDNLDEIIVPVRLSEITKKYPNLFKDFPYLKSAYHREREFTELLPTIEDAREAVSAQSTLAHVEEDLYKGDTINLLKAAKQGNPEAFNKIVDNYLVTLNEVDPQAYLHVSGNVIKSTIYSMATLARSTGDEKLMEAATLLNRHVFASEKYEPPTKLSKETKPEDDTRLKEIERREKEFNEKSRNSVRGDIDSRVNNLIKKTITVNIDPKKSMTDYVRRTAEREVFDEVDKLMKKDARTNAILTKLWDRASKNNYSEDDTNKIRSLRLSRAKSLLPAVIKKVRNEALKGAGRRKEKEDEDVVEVEDTDRESRKKVASAPRKPGDNSRRKPEGMSTRDLLGYD